MSSSTIDSLSNQAIVKEQKENFTAYEQKLLNQGFLDLGQIPSVYVSMPYTTADNFIKEVLYDSLQHALVRPIAYQKLEKAVEILKEKNPNYGFLVFDALRPNSAQEKMWNAVAGKPMQRYVAAPHPGSIHNYGCAIDLTIYDEVEQKQLPMGSAFDDLSKKAEYRLNEQLRNEGVISQQEYQNRILLRQIMRQAGFYSINREWWHFNALSKENTRSQFTIIK